MNSSFPLLSARDTVVMSLKGQKITCWKWICRKEAPHLEFNDSPSQGKPSFEPSYAIHAHPFPFGNAKNPVQAGFYASAEEIVVVHN